VPRDPAPPTGKPVLSLPEPANDNGARRKIRAKVLIPRHLPVTRTEIEVFALLLDDVVGLAANDNEGQPE
jgi:hypothetical protein